VDELQTKEHARDKVFLTAKFNSYGLEALNYFIRVLADPVEFPRFKLRENQVFMEVFYNWLKNYNNEIRLNPIVDFDDNTPYEVSIGEKVKVIPPCHIKQKHFINPHGPLHSGRVWTCKKSLLKLTGASNLYGLTNTRIATISNCAELEALFPYGNYFINQANSGTFSDKKRIDTMYRNVLNAINSTLASYTETAPDQRIENRQPGEYNKFCPRTKGKAVSGVYYAENPLPTWPYLHINNNICHCYYKDKLCKHIIEFQPEILIFPHVIYYLNPKLIKHIFAVLPKVKILVITHIFNPSITEGVYKIKLYSKTNYLQTESLQLHGYDSPIQKELDRKTPYYQLIANEYEAANWHRMGGKITFQVKDDKTYEHADVFPYLWNQSLIETDKGQTKVLVRIEHDTFQQVAILLEGEYVTADNTYSSMEQIVLTKSRNLSFAYTVKNHNGVSFLESDTGDTVLVTRVKGVPHIITFKVGTLTDGLKMKFQKIKNMITGHEVDRVNIMASNFYDFLTSFQVEVPNNEVILEKESYTKLSMLATKVDFQNVAEILNFKGIVKGFFQNYINPFTIHTITYNLLKDAAFERILTEDLARSNYLKLFNSQLRVGDDLSFLSKILCHLTKKKINSDMQIILDNPNYKPTYKLEEKKKKKEEPIEMVAQRLVAQNYRPIKLINPIEQYYMSIGDVENRKLNLANALFQFKGVFRNYIYYRLIRQLLINKQHKTHIAEVKTATLDFTKRVDHERIKPIQQVKPKVKNDPNMIQLRENIDLDEEARLLQPNVRPDYALELERISSRVKSELGRKILFSVNMTNIQLVKVFKILQQPFGGYNPRFAGAAMLAQKIARENDLDKITKTVEYVKEFYSSYSGKIQVTTDDGQLLSKKGFIDTRYYRDMQRYEKGFKSYLKERKNPGKKKRVGYQVTNMWQLVLTKKGADLVMYPKICPTELQVEKIPQPWGKEFYELAEQIAYENEVLDHIPKKKKKKPHKQKKKKPHNKKPSYYYYDDGWGPDDPYYDGWDPDDPYYNSQYGNEEDHTYEDQGVDFNTDEVFTREVEINS
jgi:hypothetical protein